MEDDWEHIFLYEYDNILQGAANVHESTRHLSCFTVFWQSHLAVENCFSWPFFAKATSPTFDFVCKTLHWSGQTIVVAMRMFHQTTLVVLIGQTDWYCYNQHIFCKQSLKESHFACKILQCRCINFTPSSVIVNR